MTRTVHEPIKDKPDAKRDAVSSYLTLLKADECAADAGVKACKLLKPDDVTMVVAAIKFAGLSKIQLYQACKAICKSVDVRASLLQEECTLPLGVDNRRTLHIPDVEPWPDSVDGSALLHEIRFIVRSHIFLNETEATAVALWIVLTHAEPYIDSAPILAITSPQKRCGKTTLIEILKLLARKPLKTDSITAAALFRSVERWSPTVLIDEADLFLKDREELRGILNSGNRRDGYVIRCNPVTLEPERFSTWGPKAIACIGKLTETLLDRSIHVELQRRHKGEAIKKLRDADPGRFKRLSRQASRWVLDNGNAIKNSKPPVPDVLNDRAGDNWLPLLAIAEVASGGWAKEAIEAAQNLSADEPDDNFSVRLLAALQSIIQDAGGEEFFLTSDLLAELNADEEAPWADWKSGLTAAKLARELKEYGIRSIRDKTVRDRRGYALVDLTLIFDRYLLDSTPESRSLPDAAPDNYLPEPSSGVSASKRNPTPCHLMDSTRHTANSLPKRAGETCVRLDTKRGGTESKCVSGGPFKDETVRSQKNGWLWDE